MIYIAKDVANGIRSLVNKREVQEWADAISKIPGVDVYAKSVAGGLTAKAAEPETSLQSTHSAQDAAPSTRKNAASAKSAVKARRRS